MTGPRPNRDAGDSTTDHDALARAAADGDRAALDELLAANYDYLDSVCRRILWRREHADALEQARQEALLAVARGIHRFRGDARFRTWSHRIAINASLRQLERHDRAPRPVDPEPGDGTFTGPAVAEPSTTRLAIDDCLERLDAPFHDAVVMHFLADLDYDEIAGRLDISVGTVKSRVSRGRDRLRTCLEGAVDV